MIIQMFDLLKNDYIMIYDINSEMQVALVHALLDLDLKIAPIMI